MSIKNIMLNKKTIESHTHHASFRRILQIAYPTILSMFSVNIMQFVDRTFVAKFDLTQFSAVMPSGIFATTVASIFLGIAGYVSSLVSQYYGARSYNDCSKTMWQGIYLSAFFTFILIIIMLPASMVFKLLNHTPGIIEYEKQYFYFIIGSCCVQLFINSIGGFFNGIGNTKIPMYTQIFANVLNFILDWIFIFGYLGLPKMGIFGAGLATFLSSFISLIFIVFFLKKKNLKYGTFKYFQFDFFLLKKLIKFGLPAGLQFFLGIGSFSFFLLLIGKMGEFPLTCANIAFTIEGISFLPILGLSTAVSIIAGQEKGANRLKNIPRVVRNGLIIAFCYNIFMMIVFNLFPGHLISIFNNDKDHEKFTGIIEFTIPLIRLSSLWLIFDSIQLTISAVLRTLGDTLFLLIITGIIPVLFMVIPTYILINLFPQSLTLVWLNVIIFVIILAIIMSARFKMGKWKKIKVI